MLEVFRSQSAHLLLSVLSDSPDSSPTPIPSSIDPDDLTIDRIQLLNLGPSGSIQDEKLHLLVWSSSGTMVLYEAFSATVPPTSSFSSSDELPPRLALRFVKSLVHHIPLSTPRRKGSNLPLPARRELITFSDLGRSHSGAFLTGEETYWIMKGRQGPARCFEGSEKGVYGFTSTVVGDFSMMTREAGLQLATIPVTTSIDHAMPLTSVPKDRIYSYLALDLDSGLYVGGTLNETRFVAFDDEGVPTFKDNSEFNLRCCLF